MRKNTEHPVNTSVLVEIEILLNEIDLNSYDLPTQFRQSIIKARHLLKIELMDFYLANALSLSNPSGSLGNCMNKAVSMGGNTCPKS
jgi:hypothetical protein